MLTIATWNINSVRLRIETVCNFLGEAKPDVLCLQEIKCRDGEFPAKAFKEAGYKHMHVVGQKGWHGVAIVSRRKLEPIEAPAICPKKEARIAALEVRTPAAAHEERVPGERHRATVEHVRETPGGVTRRRPDLEDVRTNLDVIARSELAVGERRARRLRDEDLRADQLAEPPSARDVIGVHVRVERRDETEVELA